MCLLVTEERVAIATYLSRSNVIHRVATETPAGALTRAQRVHDAYLTAWRLLVAGIQGDEATAWRALLGGPRRALDRVVAPAIRARLRDAARRSA